MSKNIDVIFCCKPEVFSIGVVRLLKLHCPLHPALLLKKKKSEEALVILGRENMDLVI